MQRSSGEEHEIDAVSALDRLGENGKVDAAGFLEDLALHWKAKVAAGIQDALAAQHRDLSEQHEFALQQELRRRETVDEELTAARDTISALESSISRTETSLHRAVLLLGVRCRRAALYFHTRRSVRRVLNAWRAELHRAKEERANNFRAGRLRRRVLLQRCFGQWRSDVARSRRAQLEARIEATAVETEHRVAAAFAAREEALRSALEEARREMEAVRVEEETARTKLRTFLEQGLGALGLQALRILGHDDDQQGSPAAEEGAGGGEGVGLDDTALHSLPSAFPPSPPRVPRAHRAPGRGDEHEEDVPAATHTPSRSTLPASAYPPTPAPQTNPPPPPPEPAPHQATTTTSGSVAAADRFPRTTGPVQARWSAASGLPKVEQVRALMSQSRARQTDLHKKGTAGRGRRRESGVRATPSRASVPPPSIQFSPATTAVSGARAGTGSVRSRARADRDEMDSVMRGWAWEEAEESVGSRGSARERARPSGALR